MKTFLFQGDSITDANRNRNYDEHLGCGYALLVAAELMKKYPGELRFLNRGVSGDRITEVYTRIKEDTINLRPDYLSILIGFNDVSHELTMQCGVDVEKFEKIYCMMIDEIKAALPEIKIILLEPFVLKGPSTEKLYDSFVYEVGLRAAATKRVAERYGLTFVPLQARLDAACERCDSSWWSGDGVHPSFAGHQLIKEALIGEVEALVQGA